ncbi:NADH:flavin oxidoreductase [Marinifilum breve]|uniref:NADH:flavin oxidoreductase n=1 Tax=Marinifilum breve TaxID=2184082 RepID=A0A2V4A0C7_9BACT|nr:NADH:flavin oxidoreductase [Marinifilum breve]PXY01973.1 NADH:flavin oxidoreductase [Marinifilum breve]
MKRLFEPVKINSLELKNRIIRSAAWMNAAEDNGRLNEQTLKIYEDLAKGGAGLVITGYAYILKEEQPNPNMLGIYSDDLIEEHQKLTSLVHENGSKIGLQIVYGGSASTHPNAKGMEFIGPSAVENRMTGITPKEATIEDFKQLTKAFGDAALRAKQAGYDAIQFHAAHGYFLSMLLTPYFNRRTDEYGGDIHGRAKLLYEIVQEVRNRVGDDFPVMIKMNYDDLLENGEGMTFEEAQQVCQRLDEIGIDLIELSAGSLSGKPDLLIVRTKLKSPEAQSYYKEAAIKISSQVKAPISFVGGNRTPDLMEKILNDSNIEFFSMARPFIAEPDLVNKWEENPSYQLKCISCNRCWDTVPVSCILNRKK